MLILLLHLQVERQLLEQRLIQQRKQLLPSRECGVK
jgi:hypothetical protein